MTGMSQSIATTQDLEYLIADLTAIKTERGWRASQEVIAAHWEIGQRIAADTGYQNAVESRTSTSYLDSLTCYLGWSATVLHRSVAFFNKFPNLELDQGFDRLYEAFPSDGKALSWRKICSDYLPDTPQAKSLPPASKAAEYSRSRVGQVWKQEDHNTLMSLL